MNKYFSQIESSKKPVPRRTLMYGVGGIGKSTWASKWPNPIFLPTEDGISDIDVSAFPIAKSFVDAGGPLQELISTDHGYQTVVIDSADWLEKLIWEFVCARGEKDHISDFPYGKGYAEAAGKLRRYLGYLDSLRAKSMHVVVIAHAAIVRFEDPAGEAYDRFQPKLHREAAAMLIEWADEVLFANYKTFTRTSDQGFGRQRVVGTGAGARVIYTQERPAFKAKNRLGLPPELPLDFDAYKKFLSSSVSPAMEEKQHGKS